LEIGKPLYGGIQSLRWFLVPLLPKPQVVAEGVETSASLDLLRQADCDTGQGFLFAKPMPAAAFAVFVSQWRGATMNANDPTATSCCVCCKEIPLDAAFTPEGAEYVE
ncbi:DUF3330 domain-containing protein, partial [Pseudomonas aeruginosa]|uniref:DUF3330 domain-containing protein n=1 Tax=Pseudomonas aeruginosa TaxID=287 RepID=UPI0029365838